MLQPRWLLYLKINNNPTNTDYINWINEMHLKYNNNYPIANHDDFTLFLEKEVDKIISHNKDCKE